MSAAAFEEHVKSAHVEPDQPWEIQVRRYDSDAILFARPLTHSFAVIGGRPDCDVPLPGVAPRHIYLQRVAGSLLAFDLGSLDFGHRTGVLGRPGRAFVDVLCHDDSVRVGDYQITVRCSPTDATPVLDGNVKDRSPLPQFTEPVACWELTNLKSDEAVIRRHVRHAVTLIGSGPLCRIRIAHPSASSVHASLVWDSGELVIVDLCSRTGVRVNDQQVRTARLRPGDELSIGHCRGVIRYLTASSDFGDSCALAGQAGSASEEIQSQRGQLSLAVPAAQVSASDEQHTAASSRAQYSEEFVLSLLAQFTAMQQQLVDQTHRLMSDVTTRLNTSAAVTATSSEKNREEAELPRSDVPEESDGTPHSEPSPNFAGVDDQDLSPTTEQNSPTKADVHAWLNQRLAGLESAPAGKLAQLWERLMGAD